MNFMVRVVSSLPGNKDCVAVYEKTCTLWDNVVLAAASLILKQVLGWCFMSQCSPRLWANWTTLKAFLGYSNYPLINSIVVSYRFRHILCSCHSTRNLVLLLKSSGAANLSSSSNWQLCLSLHLVGLTSAFLNKAEPMTIERFVHSEVLEAVSHQCPVCQSCIGGSPFCLFTFRLTVCLRCV